MTHVDALGFMLFIPPAVLIVLALAAGGFGRPPRRPLV